MHGSHLLHLYGLQVAPPQVGRQGCKVNDIAGRVLEAAHDVLAVCPVYLRRQALWDVRLAAHLLI